MENKVESISVAPPDAKPELAVRLNREIKFRVFDKKMSNPFEMSKPFNPFFYGGLFTANAKFMQATGCYDKDKKEIYEFDIMTYTVGGGNGAGSVGTDKRGRHIFQALVVYENGWFCAKQINGNGSLTSGFPLSVMSKEKIVGNYFERPSVCFLKDEISRCEKCNAELKQNVGDNLCAECWSKS